MRFALAIPLALAVSGCAMDRPSPEPPSAPAADASYRAVGTEPGWSLEIGGGMMRYTGDYGRTRIAVPTPESRASFNGHRYATRRLTVDITHASCSDGMSDRAYPDTVMVIADGGTEHGCGGPVEKGVGVTLAGTNWTIATIDGKPTAGARKAELRFTADRIAGNAGCNGFGGSYTLSGDRLTVGRVISTRMACIGPGMEQESGFFRILAAPMRISRATDGSLVLRNEAGSARLTPAG